VGVLDDTEGVQASLVDEGKPRCICPSFQSYYTVIYGCLCTYV
jgi:hypothetical protein